MNGRDKQDNELERRKTVADEERRRLETRKRQDRDGDLLDEDRLDEVLRDCPL